MGMGTPDGEVAIEGALRSSRRESDDTSPQTLFRGRHRGGIERERMVSDLGKVPA